MKKKFLLLACAALVLGFASCSKGNTPVPPPFNVTVGAYILNNGIWGDNNSTLDYYNTETKELSRNVFFARNAKKLGDLGQDMIIYGSKMYITVNGSAIIFVTDIYGNIISEIKKDKLSPRYITAYNGKVYATYYEGYLAQIDTTTYEVKTVKVGDNPDGLGVANGKIYVANSGGSNYPVCGKTVSVVNPVSMTVSKTINVLDNPTRITVDKQENVYLISNGNYMDVPSTLQKIDSKIDIVSSVELSMVKNGASVTLPPAFMSLSANNKLYIVSTVYDNLNIASSSYVVYDITTGKVERDFITDGTKISNNPCMITADPISGNVYIGSSDYVNNGDVYVFGADGKLIKKFEVGFNPIGVYFLTK